MFVPQYFAENSGLHVFSFLANSILKEVLYAIQQGKPGAFSPGRPTEFLKNYKASLGFLADLEGSKINSGFLYLHFLSLKSGKTGGPGSWVILYGLG